MAWQVTPPDGGRIHAVARWLAILGGILVFLVACVVTVSTTMRWLINESVPGDIELVQMTIAVAAFCFLPWCQVKRGNVFVDTFTTFLPARVQRALDALWDIICALIAALIAWRLVYGAVDAIRSHTVSYQLGFPFGFLILVCAAMASFLAVVTVTMALSSRTGRR